MANGRGMFVVQVGTEPDLPGSGGETGICHLTSHLECKNVFSFTEFCQYRISRSPVDPTSASPLNPSLDSLPVPGSTRL